MLGEDTKDADVEVVSVDPSSPLSGVEKQLAAIKARCASSPSADVHKDGLRYTYLTPYRYLSDMYLTLIWGCSLHDI